MDSSNVIIVQDRFLYPAKNNGTPNDRFLMKGIAFPDPPPSKPPIATPDNLHPGPPVFNYNATAWIAILKQLRTEIPNPNHLNTVRLYRMDPTLDYTEFFLAAAELGFYVLVPLTSVDNDGAILDRSLRPPECYPETLLEYGKLAWRNYGRYPNVLAGVIGNEVMNDMLSWYAAPCVKAYARDLQAYMHDFSAQIADEKTEDDDYSMFYANRTYEGQLLTMPLLYAAQHSGIGAALTETDMVRLTVDYLACQEEEEDDDDNVVLDIDIFGINVESWCSTYDTFQYNQEGSIGAYFQLFRGLYNGTAIPLIFSEMGCSHLEFDKDNADLRTPEGTRDWRDVPVVLYDMNATFSGFCAYAYWGNSLFNMMKDGPWDGIHPLKPTLDFVNFQTQLSMSDAKHDQTKLADGSTAPIVGSSIFHDLPMAAGGIMDEYYHRLLEHPEKSPTCSQVQEALYKTCDLKLEDMSKMPSYYDPSSGPISFDFLQNGTISTPQQNDGKTMVEPVARYHPLVLGMSILVLALAVVGVQWRRHSGGKVRYETIP